MGGYCWSHGHHPVGVKHTSGTCTKKKDGHVDDATTNARKGGDNFWPTIQKVRESQQDHVSFKGQAAPTNNWQGPGFRQPTYNKNEIGKAAFAKTKPDSFTNYYNILADTTPPDCQVEEQTSTKGETIHTISEASIKTKVLQGIIPSIIADSAATSNVGATKHGGPFIPTSKKSTKVQLLDGTQAAADTISELPFELRKPAKEIHNVPWIDENSLLSIPKIAEAGYITIFDNEEVNIYDARDTKVLVTSKAILTGWYDKRAKRWHVPLVPTALNKNTDTVF
jgi:hypothetical protein